MKQIAFVLACSCAMLWLGCAGGGTATLQGRLVDRSEYQPGQVLPCEKPYGSWEEFEVSVVGPGGGERVLLGSCPVGPGGEFRIRPKLGWKQRREWSSGQQPAFCTLELRAPFLKKPVELSGPWNTRGADFHFKLSGTIEVLIQLGPELRKQDPELLIRLLQRSSNLEGAVFEPCGGPFTVRLGKESGYALCRLEDIECGSYQLLFNLLNMAPYTTEEFVICPGQTFSNDNKSYYFELAVTNAEDQLIEPIVPPAKFRGYEPK